MDVCVIYLQTKHKHCHLTASRDILNAPSHLLSKSHHATEVFIIQIKEIVYLLLRDNEGVGGLNGVDVKESVEILAFCHLV